MSRWLPDAARRGSRVVRAWLPVSPGSREYRPSLRQPGPGHSQRLVDVDIALGDAAGGVSEQGGYGHNFRTILKLGTRDSEAASLGSTSIGPEPAPKRYVRPEDGPVTVMPVCPR